jgi:hypothetical protein
MGITHDRSAWVLYLPTLSPQEAEITGSLAPPRKVLSGEGPAVNMPIRQKASLQIPMARRRLLLTVPIIDAHYNDLGKIMW